MSRTNLAFIGLDAGRFGGWLARFPSAPVVVRDTLGWISITPSGDSGSRWGLGNAGPPSRRSGSSFSERTSREPSGGFQAFSSGSGVAEPRAATGWRRCESRPTSGKQGPVYADGGRIWPACSSHGYPDRSVSILERLGGAMGERPSCRERVDIPVREHSWSIPRRSCRSFLPGVVGEMEGIPFLDGTTWT